MLLLGVAFSSLEDLSNSRRTSIFTAHERARGTKETCSQLGTVDDVIL